MTGQVVLLLLCSSEPLAAAPGERVRVSVDVGFTPRDSKDWRLSVDETGRMWGDVEDSKFSVAKLPPETLTRIQGLAQCVTAVPKPEFPGPPIADTADSPAPVAVLMVRVGSKSRRIFLARGNVVEPGLRDAGPAISLVLALRRLVPGRAAYDYSPWLRTLAPRTPDPRCPWMKERWEK